jgi:hypothetical protein
MDKYNGLEDVISLFKFIFLFYWCRQIWFFHWDYWWFYNWVPWLNSFIFFIVNEAHLMIFDYIWVFWYCSGWQFWLMMQLPVSPWLEVCYWVCCIILYWVLVIVIIFYWVVMRFIEECLVSRWQWRVFS